MAITAGLRVGQITRWTTITLPMVWALGLGIGTTPVVAQSLVDSSQAPVVGPDGNLYPPGTVFEEVPPGDLPSGGLPDPSVTTGGTWGQGTSILNGDLESILNGDLGSIFNGDLGSILSGDLGSILDIDSILGEVLGGDLGSILNGDLGSILSGDLGSILDIDSILGEVLGGDLGSILNGDLGGILSDDLGSILNGNLGGILDGDLGNILGDWGGIFESGDLGGILNGGIGGDLSGVLGDLGDILNGGDLGGILNGGIGGDLGGVLGGLGGIFGGNDSYSATIELSLPSLGESLVSWNTLAGDASGALLNNVVSTFGAAPNIITGALGVPDVLASQVAVTDTVMSGTENGSPTGISQRADRFNVNPVALSEAVGKEVSRAASVGFSNTLLSEAGQQAIVEEVQATDETLSEIVNLATEAQDLDVTQDVMKNLSAMLAQQSSIQVAGYGQTIQLRQQFAADAVVQAEAAEELAAMSRRAQTEPMAAAAEVIQSSSTLVMF